MDMKALMPQADTERKKLRPCCKNKKLPWMEGTLDTNYRRDYIEKEVPMERAGRKYDEYPRLDAPRFDGTTTMQTDFKPYAAKREPMIRPNNTAMGEAGPFNGDSTYKQDFGAKEAPYERVRPKNAFEPNKAPFDGTTTNRNDFQMRAVPAPPKPVTRATNIQMSSGPFDGQSLYKDTFGRQPYAKRDLVHPARGGQVFPAGPFDDGTMYRLTYVPKETTVPARARPQDARPQSAAEWFNGLPSSEYRNQFVGKEIPTTNAVKPLHSSLGNDALPFSGETTNRADFVPFAAKREPMIRPNNTAMGEAGPFAGQSTYRDAFIPKEAPYERVRPKNAFEPNKALFDGTTTHRSAYVPMEVKPTARMQARGASLKPEGQPFEGQSTYKGDFTKMPRGLRAPIKRQDGGEHASGPFDGTTTYRKDFIEKEIPQRPLRRGYDDDCESCVDGIPGVTCRED